jgi:hypothetical protein
MESDATPQQALDEVERATAALWSHYPPTPWWYCPGSGAWHAALVLVLGGLDGRYLLQLVGAVGLLAVAVWFTNWYTTYRGTIPRVGSSMPAEFRPAVIAFGGFYLSVISLVALVFIAVGYVVAAIVAFVGVTVLFAVYERAYAAAAAATRERLG